MIAFEDVLIKEISKNKGPENLLKYATGGRADFDSTHDVIKITEFPQCYQDNDTVTGDIIIMHRDTDLVEVEHSNAFSQGTPWAIVAPDLEDSKIHRLTATDLKKSYKGRTVVKGVSFEVSSGQIVGLLGPNGAGKTTSFYMVVGLVQPDGGKVELDGTGRHRSGRCIKRAQGGIAYLPQEASVFRRMTAEENILAVLETLPLPETERRETLQNLLDRVQHQPCLAAKGLHSVGGRAATC